MIILHAGFFGQQFFLWGETPVGNHSPASLKSRSGRSLAKRRISPGAFRFGGAAEKLANALEESGLDFQIGKRDRAAAFIWVPTADGEAIPSSALIAGPPKTGRKDLPSSMENRCPAAVRRPGHRTAEPLRREENPGPRGDCRERPGLLGNGLALCRGPHGQRAISSRYGGAGQGLPGPMGAGLFGCRRGAFLQTRRLDAGIRTGLDLGGFFASRLVFAFRS